MAKGKKTGGRRPGSPNKSTRAFKEAVLDVFHLIGGVEAFAKWAKENQSEYYTKIAPRLIPTELAGASEGVAPLVIEVTERRAPASHPE